MASFAARYAVAINGTFQSRVGIALAIIAKQVMTETPTAHQVDVKRRALALKVLANPVGYAQPMALLIAAQDVPVDDTDEMIQTKVWEVWDAVAGIEAADWPQP
jgi:hypothetical protein